MKLNKVSIKLDAVIKNEDYHIFDVLEKNKKKYKVRGAISVCVETDVYRIVIYTLKISGCESEEELNKSLNEGKLKSIICMIAGVMHNNEE